MTIDKPRLHFSANNTWMNDPNGLVKVDDTFHLFYQNNPNSEQWGPIGWGHAVSEDLVNWRILEPALHANEDVMIFSGSVIYDQNNVSKLGGKDSPPLIAFYTAAHYEWIGTQDISISLQTQCIAYSLDKGTNWSQYSNNPVIDIDSNEFRDPKVFAFEDKWIMVVALSQEYKVKIYSSTNLLDWRFESDIADVGLQTGEWECPDLVDFYVDGKRIWVLFIGVGSGGPSPGPSVIYMLGNFNGSTFSVDTDLMGGADYIQFDHGQDFFALQSFSNHISESGKKLVLGWHNNWLYAKSMQPIDWPCIQSLPRDINLAKTETGYTLLQSPSHMLLNAASIKEYRALSQPILGCFILQFDVENDHLGCLELVANNGQQELFRLVLDCATLGLTFYRAAPEVHLPHFSTVQNINFNQQLETFRIQVVCDSTSIEIFINEGQWVMSNRIFPRSNETQLTFKSGALQPNNYKLSVLA